MIGRKTGQRKQQNLRAESQPHDDPDRGRIMVREFGQDDPVLRGALHPGSNIGYQRSCGPDSVIGALQRAEGAPQETAHVSPGALPPLNRPKRPARPRPVNSTLDPNAKMSPVECRSKLPTRPISAVPAARLKKPQSTFTVEEDSPSPRGLANGL